MPRFYFDIFFGTDVQLDVDGHEIDSLWAAEKLAKYAAIEIARDRLQQLPNVVSENIQVEVKDEDRLPIFMVTLSIQSDRVVDAAHTVS